VAEAIAVAAAVAAVASVAEEGHGKQGLMTVYSGLPHIYGVPGRHGALPAWMRKRKRVLLT
jgi:hypothetical protein